MGIFKRAAKVRTEKAKHPRVRVLALLGVSVKGVGIVLLTFHFSIE